MAVTVKIPTPLRALTGDQESVSGAGATLAKLVDHLEGLYPGVRDRLCEESGELRRFVNVYVNGEDVRFLNGVETNVNSGDELSIVPAVAGG